MMICTWGVTHFRIAMNQKVGLRQVVCSIVRHWNNTTSCFRLSYINSVSVYGIRYNKHYEIIYH